MYPKNNKPKCRFCGDFHFHRDCPFYKHRCQDCNTYGHRKGFCHSSQRRPYTDHRRGRYQNQHRQAHGVDAGSNITIVSAEAWKSLGSTKLDKVHFKVSSASSDAVQLSGVMKCEATFKGNCMLCG
ncbi:unnamed protein product [Hymenolepis diminuta]|uniref:Uncharacterized protein n=1 Tax=Hymenolepis diminuta TaxID=6216 RepID=A0A564YDH7_HYMDI|nr:unnamed protein product [Hymenolepis diminuta]